jgi:hypothetical protein
MTIYDRGPSRSAGAGLGASHTVVTMAERRNRDAVYFDHTWGTVCRDSEYHGRCRGRWRGDINLGVDGTGKRRRRKISGRTKSEVYDKLDDARKEIERGIKTSGNYTVEQSVEDWLCRP